jgi:chemotaxis protein CheX
VNRTATKRQPEEIFHTSLREACDGLFASLRLNVLAALGRAPGSELEGTQLASVIGFLGTQVKGSLTVRAPVSFFSGTFPVEKDGEHSLHEVSDWAGEIANQLLGRVKNKLLPYGVSFSMTTPAMIYGDCLQEAEARHGSLTIVFPWQEEQICVRFDLKLEPGLKILDEPTNGCTPLEAGDAMFF